MTFPNINYKFNDLPETQVLTELLEQKCTTLEKYFHERESILCNVEFQKVSPQKTGEIYKVEVDLTLNGTLFRAEAVEMNFEKAIDSVREELDKELRRDKEKRATLDKQSGREMKEKMLSGE